MWKILCGYTEMMQRDYYSMREIASDLNLSYSRVWELSAKGRARKRIDDTFKYALKIYITRL